jgi:hypothetical protein
MLKRIADRASLEKENRDLFRNPQLATGQATASLDAKGVQVHRVEAVLNRVEQLLLRLESRLDSLTEVPSVRR